MNPRIFKRGAIALAVAGAVAGIGLQADPSFWQARAESVVRPAAAAPVAVTGATGVDFSAIVEQNGAAVVNISVTGKAERSDASQGLPAAGRPLQEARGPAAVPVHRGDQTVVARELTL